MHARHYRPGAARFLSEDRFQAAGADLGLEIDPLTQNRYAFAGGNPVSRVEFDGHCFGPFRALMRACIRGAIAAARAFSSGKGLSGTLKSAGRAFMTTLASGASGAGAAPPPPPPPQAGRLPAPQLMANPFAESIFSPLADPPSRVRVGADQPAERSSPRPPDEFDTPLEGTFAEIEGYYGLGRGFLTSGMRRHGNPRAEGLPRLHRRVLREYLIDRYKNLDNPFVKAGLSRDMAERLGEAVTKVAESPGVSALADAAESPVGGAAIRFGGACVGGGGGAVKNLPDAVLRYGVRATGAGGCIGGVVIEFVGGHGASTALP